VSADDLRQRLNGVRDTGPDTYVAACPGPLHKRGDQRASFSVRVLADGRVLAHCHAGCPINDVLAALNLQVDALFPPRGIDHRSPPERQPFPVADVLRALSIEALVAAIIAGDIVRGYLPSAEDHDRLITATTRILAAVDAEGLDREGARIRRQMIKVRRVAMMGLEAEAAVA
jgi:hypothetical protein